MTFFDYISTHPIIFLIALSIICSTIVAVSANLGSKYYYNDDTEDDDKNE